MHCNQSMDSLASTMKHPKLNQPDGEVTFHWDYILYNDYQPQLAQSIHDLLTKYFHHFIVQGKYHEASTATEPSILFQEKQNKGILHYQLMLKKLSHIFWRNNEKYTVLFIKYFSDFSIFVFFVFFFTTQWLPICAHSNPLLILRLGLIARFISDFLPYHYAGRPQH